MSHSEGSWCSITCRFSGEMQEFTSLATRGFVQEARHLASDWAPLTEQQYPNPEKFRWFLVNLLRNFYGKIICHSRCDHYDAFELQVTNIPTNSSFKSTGNYIFLYQEVWRQVVLGWYNGSKVLGVLGPSPPHSPKMVATVPSITPSHPSIPKR